MMIRAYGHGRRTKRQAAQKMLDELMALGQTKTPDGAQYSVTSIRAAMIGL
jgi:hypothetical protein